MSRRCCSRCLALAADSDCGGDQAACAAIAKEATEPDADEGTAERAEAVAEAAAEKAAEEATQDGYGGGGGYPLTLRRAACV